MNSLFLGDYVFIGCMVALLSSIACMAISRKWDRRAKALNNQSIVLCDIAAAQLTLSRKARGDARRMCDAAEAKIAEVLRSSECYRCKTSSDTKEEVANGEA